MKVLITGGGGFLGSALAKRLNEEKTSDGRAYEVHSFSRQTYPFLNDLGVIQHQGDIRDVEALKKACEGAEAIFHTAALASMWGRWEDFYQINVVGTANVLEAARHHAVKKLVYTSSPSVIFNDDHLEGVGEEQANYPVHHLSYYAKSKAMAEQMVLKASDPNGDRLITLALRPHLIWGPGDPHLLPQVVARARAGKLAIIGNGQNIVDITYIDNAVEAHLCGLRELRPRGPACGKAYFIADAEPVELWPFLNRVLEGHGIRPLKRRVPLFFAYTAGALIEMGLHLFKRYDVMPAMTRFMALQLAKSHYFSHDRSRNLLYYRPVVSFEEGLERYLKKEA